MRGEQKVLRLFILKKMRESGQFESLLRRNDEGSLQEHDEF